MMLFSEVRLQAATACRAWTEERGCFSASEWEHELASLAGFRLFFEQIRLRISEVLSVEGVDPLGIMRKLLINESASPLSRSWLREAGFVHLEAASGIHLYALWRGYESVLALVSERFGWNLVIIRFLRTVVPLALWVLVFGLTGFRPGFLRPLILVGMRWAGTRFGFRWTKVTPILAALFIDAAMAFLLSFGTEHSFADWAPGEFHYALAWWGGILGYEWARARGLDSLRLHLALSVASWLAVLPLDLVAGHFALTTPFLSLLTVEFLVRGGYAAFLICALCSKGAEALTWMSCLFNRGVGFVADSISRAQLIRTVPENLGIFMAFMLGMALVFMAFPLFKRPEA